MIFMSMCLCLFLALNISTLLGCRYVPVRSGVKKQTKNQQTKTKCFDVKCNGCWSGDITYFFCFFCFFCQHAFQQHIMQTFVGSKVRYTVPEYCNHAHLEWSEVWSCSVLTSTTITFSLSFYGKPVIWLKPLITNICWARSITLRENRKIEKFCNINALEDNHKIYIENECEISKFHVKYFQVLVIEEK